MTGVLQYRSYKIKIAFFNQVFKQIKTKQQSMEWRVQLKNMINILIEQTIIFTLFCEQFCSQQSTETTQILEPLNHQHIIQPILKLRFCYIVFDTSQPSHLSPQLLIHRNSRMGLQKINSFFDVKQNNVQFIIAPTIGRQDQLHDTRLSGIFRYFWKCIECLNDYIMDGLNTIIFQVIMGELFETVVNQFQSNNQYDKFIKECEKEYDIKIHNLASLTPIQARKIYNQLLAKYSDHHYISDPNGWYQNQRKLFVWFILGFIHLKALDPLKFVDKHDRYDKYWRNISENLWNKDILLLKYQLLNIVKTKGRTIWKAEEDDLLIKAYKISQEKKINKQKQKQRQKQNLHKGEWNQTAKEFYRLSQGTYFKTPKQCRQRWRNHLDTNIVKGEWTLQEDFTIFNFVVTRGTKWAKMVPQLGDKRTEHMIKNRYKSLMSKIVNERQKDEKKAALIILRQITQKIERQEEQQKKRKKQLQIQECESQQLDNHEDLFVEQQSKSLKRGYKSKQIHKQKNNSIRRSSLRSKQSIQGQSLKYNHIDNSQYFDKFMSKHILEDSFRSSSYFSQIIFHSAQINQNNSLLYMGQDHVLNFNFQEEAKERERIFESGSMRSGRQINNQSLVGKFIQQ